MSLQIPPEPFLSRLWPLYRVLLGAAIRSVEGSGGTITSWYRDQLTNLAAGGQDNSQHRLGFAFDLGGPDLSAIERRAAQVWPGVVVREPDHVHVQLLPAGSIPSEVFAHLP